jgi:omega-6 fatty acid desaturase (delta-12 desaturase)
VQHQFDNVYWERGEDWDYTTAALQGSSFYKLPSVLHWLSGTLAFITFSNWGRSIAF